MKKMLLMLALVGIAPVLWAQKTTESIKVWGNCGMCKNRIEKAAKAAGADKAEWNSDTDMLEVTYNAKKTSNDQIQQKIAEVGHDTEKYKASNEVYDKLPGCCHYDRKEEAKKE